MGLSEEILIANKLRKEDEFGYGSDIIYDGIKLGHIRSKIGYRGKDLSKGINSEEFFVNNIRCIKYFKDNKSDHLIFNIHGGGFYGGGIEVTKYCSKYLAYYGNVHVIDIEYTLAPDSKFPDTMHEIYDIIEIVIQDYIGAKVAIIGDSAGAHLALNVAMLDAMHNKYISYIEMFYPVISPIERKTWKIEKFNLKEDEVNEKACIMFLKSIMPLIKKLYLKENYDEASEYLDFLNITKEIFENLPYIRIIQAEYDYFNLDIEEFIKKFNIDNKKYNSMPHGFLEYLGYVKEAKEALEQTIIKFKGQK